MTTRNSQSNYDSCYFCGDTDDIEEHHILPQRFDGTDRKSNIVDVCHDCHWKLERLYNKDFWNAIGVDDPRATKETHLTCAYQGCLNQAVGSFSTSGIRSYRCEDHKPSNIQEKPKLKSVDGGDQEFIQKTISQLELASQSLKGVYPGELKRVFERDWDIPEQEGFPTVVHIYDSRHTFKIEEENDEWMVSHEGYRES